ncbi:hypothetical protein [Edaphosphingomonas haloaromaticamans]|uniref:Uncharacterized protein n=1 Tax=Edaphosphingomonas haloaromaticamans TaxID=653954 RepID=A0A1S1HAF4_9SPHN|nr:hypothetical protein [Sphingomonas haloaromaticamans]OHT19058.1 hypothetical protein BHE75_01040 [Sphingomonas haloaromaticamans]
MIDYEADIRLRVERAWVGGDRAAELAALADVPGEREAVAAMLNGVVGVYVGAMIAEAARDNPPSHELPSPDPWADWRGDDGWSDGDHSALLAKGEGAGGVGQPARNALLAVYETLWAWWEDLPPPPGMKRRNLWRPEFFRDAEAGLTLPKNVPGEVFLFVAQHCLDRAITASHCNSVVSRVRERRKSPEGKAKRRESNSARAARHRAKARGE